MSLRVLLVAHGLPPAACGGTETYVWDLARALSRRPGVHVTVLAREGDPLRSELSVRRERRGPVDVWLVNNTFQACASFEETYRHPALRQRVASLLDDIRPDVAHVHHLTGLSTELLDEFASRGIASVVTLNDYWLMCHRGQLLDDTGRRCEGPGEDGCGACIPAAALAPPAAWRIGRAVESIPLWRPAAALARRAANAVASSAECAEASRRRANHVREMFGRVDCFLAPSRTLRQRYIRFGIPPDRIEWMDQGIDLGLFPAASAPAPAAGPLRVAFAGSLIPSKAPHVLLDAVARLPRAAVLLHVMGAGGSYHGTDDYQHVLAKALSAAPLASFGPVPHARMGERLAGADVLVVPSVWIENAPFIIREAFASRVPVIASDLGGMAEMVRDGTDGLLFPPGDSAALAVRLKRLIDEPGLLPSLRRGIRPMMGIDDDAAQLVATYERHVRCRLLPPPREQRRTGSRRIAAVILNYRTPAQTYIAARSIETSGRAVERLIVVDNGSGDESLAFLGDRLPAATVIDTVTNLGFSGGCNVGIRAALADGAEAVLILNSDAVLAPGALGSLEDAVFSTHGAGIAGPVVLSRREPDTIATAGMRFHPASGRMRHTSAGRRLSSLPPGPAFVDAVSGCAMLVRRDVFERAGLFDEAYFFSYEDLDFCARAARAGFATMCVPDALAYHEGGASIGPRSPLRVYYGMRNHLRVAERLFPLPRFSTLARRAAIVAFTGAYVARSPDVRMLAGMRALGRGAVDHLRGRYGAGRL